MLPPFAARDLGTLVVSADLGPIKENISGDKIKPKIRMMEALYSQQMKEGKLRCTCLIRRWGFCAKIKALAGQGGRVPREWVICKENTKSVDRKSRRKPEHEMADDNEGLSELQKWILDQQKVEGEVDRDGDVAVSLGDTSELIDGLGGLSSQAASTSNHQTKPP